VLSNEEASGRLSVQIDADFAAMEANLRNLHVERRAAVRARTAAIVADFDGHYGSQNFPVGCPSPVCTTNVDITEHNALFGPRVSASIGKFRPFGEVLIGIGHIHASGLDSDTSFATAVGGGIDYHVIKPIAVRFEGDYVSTRFFGTTQNNVRLSTGIVFRF